METPPAAASENVGRRRDHASRGPFSNSRRVLVRVPYSAMTRIGSVVVPALSRVTRSVVSELELTPVVDGVPTTCVVNFDNLHTLPANSFRRRVTQLGPARMAEACRTLHSRPDSGQALRSASRLISSIILRLITNVIASIGKRPNASRTFQSGV